MCLNKSVRGFLGNILNNKIKSSWKWCFLVFLFIPKIVFAQVNNNWTFPIAKGINFNGGTNATIIKSNSVCYDYVADTVITNSCNSGSHATVSDCDGNILFYSDGFNVFNKYHKRIINSKIKKYLDQGSFRTKLIVVPNPGNKSQYYLFYSIDTIHFQNEYRKFYKPNYFYSLIDVSANSGNGGIVFLGKTFNLGVHWSANICAAKHANNRDYWILVPQNTDTLNAYLLDSNGLSTKKVQSKVRLALSVDSGSYILLGLKTKFTNTNYFNFNWFSGTISMNNSNTKLFASGRDYYFETDRIWMYDFNRSSGKLSNEKSVLSNYFQYYQGHQNYMTISTQVSKNDSFLYTSLAPITYSCGYTPYRYIIQINLNTFKYQIVKKLHPNYWLIGLANGPDGKIYIFTDTFIYRIPNPNLVNCGFEYFYKFNNSYDIESNTLSRFPQTAYELNNRIFLPDRANVQENCVDTSLFYFSGDTLAHKLIWKFGDGDSVIQNAPIPWLKPIKHKYKKSGQYIVKLSAYFKECNVFKSITDTLQVKLKPSIITTKITPQSSCLNEIRDYEFTLSNADSTFVYVNGALHSKFKIDSTNKAKFSLVFVDTSSKIILCKFSNKLGCSVSFSQLVVPIIYSKVSGNWKLTSPQIMKPSNAKLSGCIPLKITFVDSSLNRIQSHVWSNSKDSMSFSNLSYTFQYADTIPNKKYYFNSVSKDGCFTLDSFTINGYPKPIMKHKISLLNLCKNENKIEFVDSEKNITGLETVFWGDGSSSIIINKPLTHHYYDTGAFLFKCIKITTNYCIDSFKTSLKIQPLPLNECAFKVIDSCEKSNLVSILNSGTNKVIVQWGDGFQDSFGYAAKVHHYSGLGPYKPQIKIVNKNVCFDTFKFPQFSAVRNAIISTTLSRDTLCVNQPLFITQHAKVFHKNDAISKINTWVNLKLQSSQILSDSIVSLQTMGKGKQIINSIIYANSTCNDTNQISFFVIPEMKLSVQTKDICLGDSLMIKSAWTNQFAVDSLIYNLNGKQYVQKSPISPNKNIFYSLATGSYFLSTSIVDRFQCKQEDTGKIQVFANPAVAFSYNENSYDENNQQLVFFDHTPSAASWNWTFEKLGNSNLQNPNLIVPVNSKLKVNLLVTDIHGCMDSLEKELLIFHEIKFSFPSAITINGDGRNDFFKSYEKQWIEKLQLKIFNRWGEKVYESNDKNFEWSPTLSGTYVYQLTIKDINRKFHYLNGTIEVLR